MVGERGCSIGDGFDEPLPFDANHGCLVFLRILLDLLARLCYANSIVRRRFYSLHHDVEVLQQVEVGGSGATAVPQGLSSCFTLVMSHPEASFLAPAGGVVTVSTTTPPPRTSARKHIATNDIMDHRFIILVYFSNKSPLL